MWATQLVVEFDLVEYGLEKVEFIDDASNLASCVFDRLEKPGAYDCQSIQQNIARFGTYSLFIPFPSSNTRGITPRVMDTGSILSSSNAIQCKGKGSSSFRSAL